MKTISKQSSTTDHFAENALRCMENGYRVRAIVPGTKVPFKDTRLKRDYGRSTIEALAKNGQIASSVLGELPEGEIDHRTVINILTEYLPEASVAFLLGNGVAVADFDIDDSGISKIAQKLFKRYLGEDVSLRFNGTSKSRFSALVRVEQDLSRSVARFSGEGLPEGCLLYTSDAADE